jgi:hypothetical protein
MFSRLKYILVSESSDFEIEMAIVKLKIHKSPAMYQIPAEFFRARGRTFCSEIHKFTDHIWNKKEPPQ